MADAKSLTEFIQIIKSIASWRMFLAGVILFGLIIFSPYPPIFAVTMERYPLICFHAWIALILSLLGLFDALFEILRKKYGHS